MTIELDDNHRKVIEITLWMLDEMLCKFDRWTSKKETHSVFYDEVNTLSVDQCNTIRKEIGESRILLSQLRDELGLHKHSEELDKDIHAMSAVFAAADLVTIQGRQIEAYGKATSEVVDYLEVKISELIKRLKNISSVSRNDK